MNDQNLNTFPYKTFLLSISFGAICFLNINGLIFISCFSLFTILLLTAGLETLSLYSKKVSDLRLKLILCFCALCFAFICFEAFLQIHFHFINTKWKNKNNSLQTHDPSVLIPKELARKTIEVEGAHYAEIWHGHLHLANQFGHRFKGTYSQKDKSRYRIIIFGDSLTYGEGVALESSYPSLIEKNLSPNLNIEVLNLGVRGASSEDIAQDLEKGIIPLDGDLYIYGVCLNDYMPSRFWEKKNDTSYALPLPQSWLTFFENRCLSSKFLTRNYNRSLIAIGLRPDYEKDIKNNVEKNTKRFKSDLKRISIKIKESGAPPPWSIILSQSPRKNHTLSLKTEQLLSDHGFKVIPSENYYQKYHGKDFKVSPWEGHPNEEAHTIFAQEILKALQTHPFPERYKK